MNSRDMFDKDYFENGIKKGVSLYTNYHWMPERSFKEAHWFINHMDVLIDEMIIDYGCAKGYLVKALRILGYQAFGFDISEYALDSADDCVKEFLFKDINIGIDVGICKDVLEHCLDESDLLNTLHRMKRICDRWLIIVPLAVNGEYVISLYDKDITHHIRFDENKWIELFKQVGFNVTDVNYNLFGFKDKWNYTKGNLFIKTE